MSIAFPLYCMPRHKVPSQYMHTYIHNFVKFAGTAWNRVKMIRSRVANKYQYIKVHNSWSLWLRHWNRRDVAFEAWACRHKAFYVHGLKLARLPSTAAMALVQKSPKVSSNLALKQKLVSITSRKSKKEVATNAEQPGGSKFFLRFSASVGCASASTTSGLPIF